MRTVRSAARVRRERQLALVHASRDVPVVVVSAPAGSGKSVLASQWVESEDRAHAVLRLDPSLDDPAALADHLLEALERLDPQTPVPRSRVTAVEPIFSAVLLPLLRSTAASRTRPYVLVLDDVHLLADPRCAEVLAAVCAGVPVGSQVALLTRARPPAWLARMRAEDRVVELGPSDLAFDDDEARALFAQAGVTVEPATLAAVTARCEGWAVGLYLAALSMREHAGTSPDERTPAHAGADEYVREYVRAEVLTGFDAADQEFLRRTAVLGELDAARCDAVLERQDSAAVLGRLARANQLVVSSEAGGYRYHHLLREALLDELTLREPQAVPTLHERAARWHAARGDLDGAVRHAAAAGRTDLVAGYVWPAAPRVLGGGYPDVLGRWLRWVDDAAVAADPWLTLAAAFLEMELGNRLEMTRLRLGAEAHAGRGWEARASTDEYAASLAVLECVVGLGGLQRTHALGTAASAALPPDSGWRTPALFVAGVSAALLRQPDVAHHYLEECVRVSEALGVALLEADALSWLGMAAGLRGDWDGARPLLERADSVCRAGRLHRLATGAHTVSAQALWLAVSGRRAEAGDVLATARRLTALTTDITPWFRVYGPLLQARTAILLGDLPTARQLCREAKANFTPDLTGTLVEDLAADVEEALARLPGTAGTTEALTAAEIRVLQYLPSHLTMPQIGEHLFVSQNTVKSHALSIYRKLGVRSRDEAVARARDLGFLEPLSLG